MTSEKPLAFVIMPFGEAFDTTWSRLIKPPLERAGFRVVRGDA